MVDAKVPKLAGRSALIAGATGGFGLAAAQLLAAEGCRMHLAAKNGEALERAAADLADRYGVETEALPTDLSDTINAAVLALDCQDVDILINAFGSLPGGDLESLDGEDWKAAFELRFFAAVNLCREVIEGMTELGAGVVINVGGGAQGQPCAASVNAALKAFSENLDKRTRKGGVRVVAFIPDADAGDEMNAAAILDIIDRNDDWPGC